MVFVLSSRITVCSAILSIAMSAGVSTRYDLSADAIFDDLMRWDKRCYGQDSCQGDRISDNLGDNYSNAHCHCDSKCKYLGTCCADSRYRTRYALGIGFGCRSPNLPDNQTLFMMDRCSRKWNGEDFVQDLCLGDAQALNDPFLLVPVTSPRTGIIYRNYFCFVCNEDIDSVSPALWRLSLYSESENVTGELLPNLQYDERAQQWTISGTDVFVTIGANSPEAFSECLIRCVPSVIDTCDENWTDLEIKQKCQSYMALVFGEEPDSNGMFPVFRNPHCAVCNFFDVSQLLCDVGGAVGGTLPPLIREFYLDLQNRCGRYEMFDPISRRCRRVRCGENQAWYQGECRDRF